MNFTEILRKVPREKLYNNPQLKEAFSNAEREIINNLNKMIKEKRDNTLRKNVINQFDDNTDWLNHP